MQEVLYKEVLKLLNVGIIYPISNNDWVTPVEVVPKKWGIIIVKDYKNELIPTRTIIGWRVYIDCRRLNNATRKDHFPLLYIDQMLKRLAGHAYYYILDGYSGYCQSPWGPRENHFHLPYGFFAYRRMPFELCNALTTFQWCIISIFLDMVEKYIEIFMDNFSIFENSFYNCLINFSLLLKRCKQTNLVLNWEKCHFMIKDGIILGHKIPFKGIEVNKAKIDVIAKVPPPSNVKGI